MMGVLRCMILPVRRARRRPRWTAWAPVVLSASLLAGCSDELRTPTRDQLAAFGQAASVETTVDVDRIRQAKLQTGPYRVVPGDVLEFTMPALLRAVRAAEVQAAQGRDRPEAPYICRVSTAGAISLPAAGELKDVAGLSLADIEEKVVAAYQSHVRLRPSVFIRVLEYKTAKVYIAGAVEKPGVYTLRSDQMTLVSLLTEAGGIAVPRGAGATAAGAAVVRILRAEEPSATSRPAAPLPVGADPAEAGSGQRPREPGLTLPVVDMSIPFQDVSLEEGDTVVVEQVQVPLFTVVGLVNKPGNYEYPPTAHYNLMQALAFAGGLDLVAEPRYATIYRLDPEGSVVRIPFRLVQENELTEAISTPIRPGDIVAIEQTPRTRMNTMFRTLLRLNTGLYLTGRDLWD